MQRTILLCSLVVLTLACQTQKSAKKPANNGKQNQTQVEAAPKLPPEFIEVASLEDRRSFGEGNKLLTWALTANDPALRGRSLLALGRIQDVAAADTLIKGLTDPDPGARSEAAFAIGLLGQSWSPIADDVKNKLTDALKATEAEEQDVGIKLVIIEALGRLASPAAVNLLVDRLTVPGDVQARAALSIGIAARTPGVTLPPKTFNALAGLIKKEMPPVARYGAAYALAQSKNPSARTWLLMCAGDDASEIRAICAKGLGDVGQDVDAVTLKKLLDDPDYRVAVEATKALAKLTNRCKGSACAALGALADLSLRVERLLRGDSAGGGQPLLMLAQTGLPMSGRPLLQSLRQELLNGVRQVQDARIRQDIANVECRIAAALDKQTGSPQEVLNCGGNLISEPQRLSMVLKELATVTAADPNKRAAEIGSFVFHNDARVKVAALEVLGETKSQTSIDKVRTQLLNADPVVAAYAASAAAKLGDKGSIATIRGLAMKAMTQVDIAPTVAEALANLDAKEAIPDLEQWLTSTNATIRNSAASALSRLKGTPVVAARVERPDDKVRPPSLPKEAHLLIKTEKGEFDVKLFTQESPLTALNMYTLARKNFFKGLTFHRVVPDFVAQGGDPRGDGEGGPGYTVRCEVNHRVYARGVVGMALSGKDTGGSQFFVTAAPQPHLDGKYTAFGEVVKGQEVVDALLEGDKIVEIRATP
ncbi:MAG: peptidyl-prolyl cis-trans isomerase [Archangiaceae bacterium]|nr:peptidyl-prolyl cis-trans isomerase [Archangiaceae bacterium]